MARMKSRINVDRISILPKNIIDSILTRLPILEAVRTSILSRSWRYQCHSLSKINMRINNQLDVKNMDHILLVHCGSVDKFKVTTWLETCNDIDRWILYVSRNGIKELIVEKWGEYYNLPSCLFSCSDLTYLELRKCIIKPLPTAFKAFNNLRELTISVIKVAQEVLEKLINSCPLLNRLRLLLFDPHLSLKINVPSLVMLHVSGWYRDFQLINTPLLASVSFGHAADNKDCKIIELFGSMPILRRLEFHDYALQHLAVGYVPPRLPSICPIKHLTLCINFEDLKEMLAAFCIFRSSPYIQTLGLMVFSDKDSSRISADGFWEGEHDFSFRFDQICRLS